jgi:hypothetical protein
MTEHLTEDDFIAQLEMERQAAPFLPELIINMANTTETAKELAVLIAQGTNFLFNGNTLVRIVVEKGNMPHAVEVTNEAVRVLAHELSNPHRWRKLKDGGFIKVPVSLSRDIAQIYLLGLEGSWGLKPFKGITTTPILANDGAIRSADGYDDDTALWCHRIPKTNVPERPTEADAKAALHRLRYFFAPSRSPTAHALPKRTSQSPI